MLVLAFVPRRGQKARDAHDMIGKWNKTERLPADHRALGSSALGRYELNGRRTAIGASARMAERGRCDGPRLYRNADLPRHTYQGNVLSEGDGQRHIAYRADRLQRGTIGMLLVHPVGAAALVQQFARRYRQRHHGEEPPRGERTERPSEHARRK